MEQQSIDSSEHVFFSSDFFTYQLDVAVLTLEFCHQLMLVNLFPSFWLFLVFFFDAVNAGYCE